MLKIPVEQQERRFEDEYCVELEEYERRVIIWQAEFKVLNKLYKSAESRGDTAETRRKLEECISRQPQKPVRKSIILTNPTSEALTKEIGMGYQNKALLTMKQQVCIRVVCTTTPHLSIHSGVGIKSPLTGYHGKALLLKIMYFHLY